jgi:hypothetical protein
MWLDEVTHESCTAHIATGDGWATIYIIESEIPNQGHAQVLLKDALDYYQNTRKLVLGCSVTLNDAMKHIIDKFNIPEYSDY